MKDFTAHADIKHLNIRKQGEDQEVLAVDIKLRAELQARVLDSLMCEDLNDGLAEGTFWMRSEDKAPVFPQLGEIAFSREYRNVQAKLCGFEVYGCTLKKFSFRALPEGKAETTFSVTITEPPPKLIDTLASMLAEAVLIDFSCPQGDLLQDGGDPLKDIGQKLTDSLCDAGVTLLRGEIPSTATDELAYMQAVDFVRVEGKASVSFVQCKLGIGYNAAARLVERMEAEGIVGPAGPGGSRDILAATTDS